MANIEAGNDRELIIRDLVESYDLTITSSSRPGGICAVSTLINIYGIVKKSVVVKTH